MSILVFDSGLGGLSILREVHAVLPAAHIVYLADDAGFPYGEWDQDKLVVRIIDVIATAIEQHQPELIILACNTASTIALDGLRARFDVPFVGTVPAIKPAAEQTASGLISVLATMGTVKREYTKNLIAQFASDREVCLVGSEKLAELAEAHLAGAGADLEEIREQIAPCFVEKNGKRTDIIVLACTHYPFLINQFRKVAPWPVDWLDPAEPIARQAKILMGKTAGDTQPDFRPDIAQFTSNNPSREAARLVVGFGLKTI